MTTTADFILRSYPLLLTFKQVQEITGINHKTMHEWKNKGCLPFDAIKIGRSWRVSTYQVAEFIDSLGKGKAKRRPGRPRKEEQYEAIGRQ